jgi:hypothetical protein
MSGLHRCPLSLWRTTGPRRRQPLCGLRRCALRCPRRPRRHAAATARTPPYARNSRMTFPRFAMHCVPELLHHAMALSRPLIS